MTEAQVKEFWQNNPCGETLVGGSEGDNDEALENFFAPYDDYRYAELPQILTKLDNIDLAGRRVLEIGLGEGSDSEQMIRRGAIWSGLDLTEESVRRVRKRLAFRKLRIGTSSVEPPWTCPFRRTRSTLCSPTAYCTIFLKLGAHSARLPES